MFRYYFGILRGHDDFGQLGYSGEEDAEQVGTSNGGQRLHLNSGFPSRRGWPIRSAKNDEHLLRNP
jgi:hypothetical protein